ncbi:FAD-dependent oxidoreductase [Microbacterium sp. CH12i]|uniref:FAD-dependent oxidoreductase n=1 Tax=Microbacterium sp. CH12i TaxID=1479651 RepID=UPI000A88CD4C
MAEIEVDVLVIGWGKGGKTLAGALGRQGRSIALVEESTSMYGGSCINIACVPTKDLVHSASERRPADDPQAWFTYAVAGRDALTKKLRARNHAMLDEVDSVTLIDGHARFVGPHDVEVTAGADVLSIRAQTIVINTGTRRPNLRSPRRARDCSTPPRSNTSSRFQSVSSSLAVGMSDSSSPECSRSSAHR